MQALRPREVLALKLGRYLRENPKEEYGAESLSEATGMSFEDLALATTELSEVGVIFVQRAHFAYATGFISIALKSSGLANFERYVLHKETVGNNQVEASLDRFPLTPTSSREASSKLEKKMNEAYKIVGSPYGFQEDDWSAIIAAKKDIHSLNVVLGMQFESQFYDTTVLIENIEKYLNKAVKLYNEINRDNRIHLNYKQLKSGIGEHLFNNIARDILSSDISFFETSDNNSNVMIEMGIALTCGALVVPIRLKDRPVPPSDISGQTWIEYQDSAKVFPNIDLDNMLKDMITKAIKKKTNNSLNMQ